MIDGEGVDGGGAVGGFPIEEIEVALLLLAYGGEGIFLDVFGELADGGVSGHDLGADVEADEAKCDAIWRESIIGEVAAEHGFADEGIDDAEAEGGLLGVFCATDVAGAIPEALGGEHTIELEVFGETVGKFAAGEADCAHPFAGTPGGGGGAIEELGAFIEGVGGDGDYEIFFAREVKIEGAFCVFDRFRKVVHIEALKAFGEEDFAGFSDDEFLALEFFASLAALGDSRFFRRVVEGRGIARHLRRAGI